MDVDTIRRAYEFAAEVHGSNARVREAYVSHTVEVATILASPHRDTGTIVAWPIHDTLEDTEVSVREVERRFGPHVAPIVDGATKLGKVHASEQQVENYR